MSLDMTDSDDSIATSLKKIIDMAATDEIKKLTMKELANMVGLNENLLSQLFKRKRDFNLSKLIYYKKIQKAYDLLKTNPHISVGEIAFIAGYEKTEYFSELIKKHFGKTPSQIQKESLNNPQ